MPLATYWMHNEYLNMGMEKMAKSGENFITLQTLKERGIHPLAYRYFLLQAHYRSPINFSWEALEAAQNAYFRLLLAYAALSADGILSVIPACLRADTHRQAKAGIKESMDDDLNTPAALATLWKLLKEKNREAILEADRVLGLDINNQSKKLAEEMSTVPEDIRKLSAAREDARRAKDFSKADSLREEIRTEGFNIMDTDSGSIIRKSLR